MKSYYANDFKDMQDICFKCNAKIPNGSDTHVYPTYVNYDDGVISFVDTTLKATLKRRLDDLISQKDDLLAKVSMIDKYIDDLNNI